ncbi:hypothetical protein HDU76_011098 [Blyttiomyces sp. JEL0837]|nr:hypothetical protein HDU76_011098 [Blyttiomyces sp. JEL0837]
MKLSDHHHLSILTDLPLNVLITIVLCIFDIADLHEGKDDVTFNSLRNSCRSLRQAVDATPKCVLVDVNVARNKTVNPNSPKEKEDTVNLMERSFRIKYAPGQKYKTIMTPKATAKADTACSTTVVTRDVHIGIRKTPAYLSIDCCSVEKPSLKTVHYDVIFRDVSFGRGVDGFSEEATNTNSKQFMSILVPARVTCKDEYLHLFSELSQSRLHLALSSTRKPYHADFTSVSHFADCLWKLEMADSVFSLNGLDKLVHLTDLSFSPRKKDEDFRDIIERNEIDISKLNKLSFLYIPRDSIAKYSMGTFLAFNSKIPSLKGFGVIDLGENPHDLIMSHKDQQRLPPNCQLDRYQVLRVAVRHFGTLQFGALIEALVHSFTGVRRLIVESFSLEAPLGQDIRVLLHRARHSTRLSELVFQFLDVCDEDMGNFESSCQFSLGKVSGLSNTV